MSSHREAPEISKDPAADNTDVYAWVDQTDPSKVNLIANFNPFEIPYGGPNFHEFADDVLYTINISNAGQSQIDISYQFRFTTTIRNQNTFLYNTGPIGSVTDPNFNRPQTYSVTKVVRTAAGKQTSTLLGSGLTVPPCNVGERSTPDYEAKIGSGGVHALGTGRTVFCGPRSDAFFVDLGSIFDLGGLRPINEAHLLPLQNMPGVNGLQGLNIHTIALQMPITELAYGGKTPTDKTAAASVIGVWSSTYRTTGRLFDKATSTYKPFGNPVQISRLGNPLFNEVINPMAKKDAWNASAPSSDSNYAQYVDHPELANLLPYLYPKSFPNLDAYNKTGKARADLDAILLTGIPASVLGGALGTYTGPVKADMLRLNLAQAPTEVGKESEYGVLGGDLAGFPNGRRPLDNVTAIELRAVAGATIPLVDPTYKPDDAAGTVTDGTTNTNPPLLSVFPYLGTPNNGYAEMPPTPSVG